MKPTLTILIPTRNRASLAISAARSVLESHVPATVQVVVSDNSTDRTESSALAEYARHAVSDALALIRPPKPLSMTEHWEWAMTQAVNSTPSSHFAVLTDRMLFRPGQLASLLEIVDAYPNSIVSYTYDRVHDHSRPVAYQPLPRSGQLFRLDSSNLLKMAARMTFPSCLPRMLNSIAPRTTLDRLRGRFGSIFDSVSPDYCYCFRALSQEKSIIYYDKSVLISYAHDRSNGANTSRGSESSDSKDFLQTLANGALNRHTLVPAIMTVGNAVVNEYNFVRAESKESTFFEIDENVYLKLLAKEVSKFEDRAASERSLQILERAGWKKETSGMYGKWMEIVTAAALRFLSRHFETTAEAIAHAQASKPLTHPAFSVLRKDLNGRKLSWVARPAADVSVNVE